MLTNIVEDQDIEGIQQVQFLLQADSSSPSPYDM